LSFSFYVFKDPFETIEILSHINPKPISCEFSETHSTFSNLYEFTCNVQNPIDSSNLKFEERPENQRVSIVIFNDKEIKFLPREIGKSFPNMIELIAEGLQIDQLNPEVFRDMFQLKHLDLSNNELASIITEVFDNLPSLESLNLNKNKLKFFSKPWIPTLKVLSLRNNEFSYLDPATFSALPELLELDLDNNQLTSIDEKSFEFNPKLKKISLAANKLRSISSKIFMNLRELDTIDFTKNYCIDSRFTENSLNTMYREIEEKCASCQENLQENLQKNLKTRKNFENLKKENKKLKLLLKVIFRI
jgi:Leucine-rich repeat (LRR) protein